MEQIKVGDKVRVREDAPRVYFRGWKEAEEYEVYAVGGDAARITHDCMELAIPLKYLIKVEEEKKEAKFKVGDELVWDKGMIVKVDKILTDGKYLVSSRVGNRYIVNESDLEPYTEQTEQTEAEKPNVGSIKIPVEVDLTDGFWDAYAADLAKEIAVKVANKFNGPEQAAEYAVKVAKAVAEGLKRK